MGLDNKLSAIIKLEYLDLISDLCSDFYIIVPKTNNKKLMETFLLHGIMLFTGCRIFIPEENLVWCPETLMKAILAQVHYCPPEWEGQAHTAQVRLCHQ